MIDELQLPQPAPVIPLEMKDPQQYLGAGRGAGGDVSAPSQMVRCISPSFPRLHASSAQLDVASLIPALVDSINGWAISMAEVSSMCKANDMQTTTIPLR
jgi:hypothetical protein